MNNLRRLPLTAVMVTALVITAALSTFLGTSNPSKLSSGLLVASNSESAALYCSGLTSSSVTFLNTTSTSHKISLSWTTDTGQSGSESTKISGNSTWNLSSVGKGKVFAVAAQVNGGGVVAAVVVSNGLQSACSSIGAQSWFGAGFDTTVGSTGDLSIYNPTATAAVFNVSTYSDKGFNAPAAFQGLSVNAHQLFVLNLGTQLVNTSNIGVRVKVLRGSLDIIGIQQSGNTVSYYSGQSQLSKQSLFPLVTTENGAKAQLRYANPGSKTISVTVKVSLPPYNVPAQSLTVLPYSSGEITITPNTAIPANGYAFVSSSSSDPILTTLVLGTSKGTSLSALGNPSSSLLFANFNGTAIETARVTNTSKQSVTVSISSLPSQGVKSSTSKFHIKAGETVQVKLQHIATGEFITAPKSVLLATVALQTTPAGVNLLSALNSR